MMKHFKKSKRPGTRAQHWVAFGTYAVMRWFIEVTMILASFFWAIEAGAGKSQEKPRHESKAVAQVEPARSPSSARGYSQMKLFQRFDEHMGSNSRWLLPQLKETPVELNPLDLKAPSSITSGIYLPASIRDNPYYSSPTTVLLRFRTW